MTDVGNSVIFWQLYIFIDTVLFY